MTSSDDKGIGMIIIIVGFLAWLIWMKFTPPDAPEYAALTSGTPEAAAFDELLRDADGGQTDAQYKLGGIYAKGEIVPQDDDKAIEWYSRAAKLGHADAQLTLAYIYYNDDARRDKKEAAKWFLKAGEQGVAEAQLEIGDMYSRGDGVPQNKQEAAQWFHRAAALGDCDAQAEIVYMYHTGEGVEKNLHEAGVRYLILASSHRNNYEDKDGWWKKFALLMTDAEINAIKKDARQRIEKLGNGKGRYCRSNRRLARWRYD